MIVNFETEIPNLKLVSHVIRTIASRGEKGQLLEEPSFQAIISDARKKPGTHLKCLLRYVGPQGEFLGLDEGQLWGTAASSVLSLSMPITVPEGTEAVLFTIDEVELKRNDTLNELSVLLVTGAIVGLLILLYGYFFG